MSTITLFGPTAFCLSLLLIATPFVSYYSQTAIMYKIYPSSCDPAMYVNQSSWYTGPWVIIPAFGVCPQETYAYHPMTGYSYHDCMAFTEKPKWVAMDEANYARGYKTYMKNGANTWIKADECLIVGTIFLFLIPFAVIGLGSGEDDEQVLVLFTLLIAVPVAFCVTLIMFLTVQQTYQVKPEAWAVYIFDTCNVTIETSYGLYLVMYVLAVCGVLVVTSYGGLAYFGYKECQRYYEELEVAAADAQNAAEAAQAAAAAAAVTRANANYGSTSQGRTDSSLVPAGTDTGTAESANADGSGRRGKKKSTRYYQTAVEYRRGVDDYYSLPQASATAVPVTVATASNEEEEFLLASEDEEV